MQIYILKNPKKSYFFFKSNIFGKFFFSAKKIKKSTLFLNIRNTRFDQSSILRIFFEKIWKHPEKSFFFRKSQNFENIVVVFWRNKMLFPLFCKLRRLVFDQSSTVQPISESRGGTLSVTEKDEVRTDGNLHV